MFSRANSARIVMKLRSDRIVRIDVLIGTGSLFYDCVVKNLNARVYQENIKTLLFCQTFPLLLPSVVKYLKD